jgi:cbb3-type cytochrome oxidase maturation protein
MWTTFLLISLAAILGIAAWLIFLWSVKTGQYDDPERPKYRMLKDDEENHKKS